MTTESYYFVLGIVTALLGRRFVHTVLAFTPAGIIAIAAGWIERRCFIVRQKAINRLNARRSERREQFLREHEG